MIYKIN